MPLLIETKRSVIREFYPNEEDAFVALFADPRVNQHLRERTEDEIRTMFRDTLAEYAAGSLFSNWAVIDKGNDSFVGMGLLRPYEDKPGKLEVGYALNVPYWGRGLASEITAALINYAKQFPNIDEIVAVTTTNNYPSQKVLTRSGLTLQGNIVRNNTELCLFKLSIK
ncbi:GNAT family N-acetyltransferase [Mucilaginibacter myungsuensis]|uniref:GNAT family N-acetyltransferase n=1 Tax=Mucilaginibacter myungsuensis TaxID=649104 RepID=A0A929KUW4_9SPHI|nr:GNAT family N-acetyltransferase [Mucilaginibacter myungsuensis]MBE9661617.1 GNAT family N-acetyltransferase [Mucilaginibacter myungsuensis]MDN3597761.1 GNAT family N-acetyltransferase [Mucilaginibacter myungsuensis]